MIINIALGIVLGVVLLMLLPVIAIVAGYAIVAVFCVAVLAAFGWLLWQHPEAFVSMLVLGGISYGIFYGIEYVFECFKKKEEEHDN